MYNIDNLYLINHEIVVYKIKKGSHYELVPHVDNITNIQTIPSFQIHPNGTELAIFILRNIPGSVPFIRKDDKLVPRTIGDKEDVLLIIQKVEDKYRIVYPFTEQDIKNLYFQQYYTTSFSIVQGYNIILDVFNDKDIKKFIRNVADYKTIPIDIYFLKEVLTEPLPEDLTYLKLFPISTVDSYKRKNPIKIINTFDLSSTTDQEDKINSSSTTEQKDK